MVSSVSKSIVPKNKGSHNYARVFEQFGVDFHSNGSAQAVAEACPWCDKDRFYLNIETGQYDCKHCHAKGNVTTYLTWLHRECLKATKLKHLLRLKAKRGIATQTLRRHELAFDLATKLWLIPFKSTKGNVVNIQQYSLATGKKYNLPELPTSLYGLDRLSHDPAKIVFICEGPFDAIALDYHLGLKRNKYDIVATPGTFKEGWADLFRGRKVRALYDNDDGGEAHRQRVAKLLGESGAAAELRVLKWPAEFPKGCDINDLVRDPRYQNMSIVGFTHDHCVKVTATPKLIFQHGKRKANQSETIEWVWPDHLRCGTYVSFSGRQGTFKSTIMQEIAARYSVGKAMPLCDEPTMPAGHVLYIYAEDDREQVENGFESAGGNFENLTTMPAQCRDGDPLNLLNHLPEIEESIREHDIRLVIIDGQNSVVGAPNIATDMLARSNVTNRLHHFAQRLNVCLIGIRNEDSEGRALGPQSMGDIGRCVLRAEDLEQGTNPPYCRLVFVKVSDTARKNYPPIHYSVKDLGGSRRKILWGKSKTRAKS